MQTNFLKQIVEDVAGEESSKIVDLLSKKNNVNEFNIAKKLGLTINQTRNLLYKLSHLGILSSVRKKDKRKGWYIYFWTLNVLKSLEILEAKIEEELADLEKELRKRQSERFFKCSLCGGEVNEEGALLHNFECPECGEIYLLSEKKEHVEEITKRINKLTKDLDLIKGERGVEQNKKEKQLSKEIKKREEDKKLKRAERASIRKKEKEKLAKADAKRKGIKYVSHKDKKIAIKKQALAKKKANKKIADKKKKEKKASKIKNLVNKAKKVIKKKTSKK